VREAELRAPRDPRTVYLGGGTPSLLTTDELGWLLSSLDQVTGFRSSALEVTAECNPESLDEEKARALLELGVGRLSIGFQSLHDDVLELFGRVHTVDQSFAAFEAARRAGAPDLNIDLIFAVPGQSPEQWSRDLARVLELRPEHVSAYNLTFEEETRFGRWLEQGRLAQPAEELELELFQTTRALVAQAGYDAYEISNFSLNGHRCSHNVNYWHNGEYVGIGPSAVSKIGHERSGNVRTITGYGRRVLETGSARTWEETPEPASRLAVCWGLGLWLSEGVVPDAARRTSGFEGARDPALAVARELAGQGLLEEAGSRFRLTQRGLPLADYVAKFFL
jgi:oxygen-independent coproporphyrinogen-3 oxidase